VRDALDALVAAHPALEARVRSGDGVPTFLNVFVDGEDIRLLHGLDTEVGPEATVLLLPAVAGGALLG
jgi:molybdopterin converting factor small subunit